MVSESGEKKIQVVSLDEMIDDSVTFIKMDIEGAELKAFEYYVAAEPPVRCGESHHSGQTEPPYY